MAKTYYSLLSLEPGKTWAIEFGDYDREVVAQEMQDYRDNIGFGGGLPKGSKFKIIATGPLQVDITNKVAELNAALPVRAPVPAFVAEFNAALDAFAARHGRKWRDALYTMWCNGQDYYQPEGATLRSIRNQPGYGHEYVAAYKPAKGGN